MVSALKPGGGASESNYSLTGYIFEDLDLWLVFRYHRSPGLTHEQMEIVWSDLCIASIYT
jgi:hypothetical protein